MKKIESASKQVKVIDRTPVRLQKLLAEAGVASRRACEALIESGRVEVNGQIVTKLGTQATRNVDRIKVDGHLISLEQKVVFVFNKPRGVISSLSDPQGRPCIADYIEGLPFRLFPVGRLDFDVCGLIVLTNDGLLSNSLLHPKFQVKRKYVARLKGNITEKSKSILLKGINLPDGFAKASELEIISSPSAKSPNAEVAKREYNKYVGHLKDDESLVSIVVKEGRNHFVKRIFEAVSTPVKGLMREEFGPYTLGNLRSGELKRVGFNGGLLG